MDIFNGGTNWGFTASDIWTNGMMIVGSLAVFILLGLAVKFVPHIIWLIRNGIGVTSWYEEAKAMSYAKRYKSRGYYHMNGQQESRAERRGAWKVWE